MYHRHFNSIPSTQIYLKDNFEELKLQGQEILISCSEQSAGIGRSGNSWDLYPNSLAMSFILEPNETPTFTPLEIGLMVIDFFQTKLNKTLFLKWPNDILNSDGKKCGGILCQYVDKSTVIAGLGINLGKLEAPIISDYRHGLGSVDPTLELQALDQEKISIELYQFILQKRLANPLQLKEAFNKFCYHLNKNVSIRDNGEDHIGIFRGIGDHGEALLEANFVIRSFFSSSLTILN